MNLEKEEHNNTMIMTREEELEQSSRCDCDNKSNDNGNKKNDDNNAIDDEFEARKQRLLERKTMLKQKIMMNRRKKQEDAEAAAASAVKRRHSDNSNSSTTPEEEEEESNVIVNNDDGDEEKEQKLQKQPIPQQQHHNHHYDDIADITETEFTETEGSFFEGDDDVFHNNNDNNNDHCDSSADDTKKNKDSKENKYQKKLFKYKSKLQKLQDKQNKIQMKRVEQLIRLKQKKDDIKAEMACIKMKIGLNRKSKCKYTEYVKRIDTNRPVMKYMQKENKTLQKEIDKMSIIADKIQLNNSSLLKDNRRNSITFRELTGTGNGSGALPNTTDDLHESFSSVGSIDHWNNANDNDDDDQTNNNDDTADHSSSSCSTFAPTNPFGQMIDMGNQLEEEKHKLRVEQKEIYDELEETTEEYFDMGKQRYEIQQTVEVIYKIVTSGGKKNKGVKNFKLRKDITEIVKQVKAETRQTFAVVEEKYGPIERATTTS